MKDIELEEIKVCWNKLADDWRIQVGDEGDGNRVLNSDPVLWRFVGDNIKGLSVLDVGCGTGYLSKKLYDKGANVVGIDISERMIEIAKGVNPEIDFHVDSCSSLATIKDEAFDMIISNYVLMDTPDICSTMIAFNRVLKPEGVAILIFSHPCFPQGTATISEDGKEISYLWTFPYFQETKLIDPPWAHFKSTFRWFHRPLSHYWKAFMAADFAVIDFEEPRITEDKYHLVTNEKKLRNAKNRAYSIAFKLQKKPK